MEEGIKRLTPPAREVCTLMNVIVPLVSKLDNRQRSQDGHKIQAAITTNILVKAGIHQSPCWKTDQYVVIHQDAFWKGKLRFTEVPAKVISAAKICSPASTNLKSLAEKPDQPAPGNAVGRLDKATVKLILGISDDDNDT